MKQQQEQSIKEQVDTLKAKAHDMKLKVLTELVQDQGIKQAIIDKFTAGFFKTYYKANLSFEDNIKNPAIGGFMVAEVGRLYPELFEEAEQLMKQAEAIERRI